MTFKAYNKSGECREGIYSFSQTAAQSFISNYLDKIVWVLIFFLVVYIVLIVGRAGFYGIISLLFLCTLPFLFGKIQKKFAHQIILDFNQNSAQLYMNRSSEIIKFDFEELINIRLNGYIIFVLKEKKVFYAESQNKKLLKCLNKIKAIEWGFLCNLFGPNKHVREEIGKSWGRP
jgi:hypothetical protein